MLPVQFETARHFHMKLADHQRRFTSEGAAAMLCIESKSGAKMARFFALLRIFWPADVPLLLDGRASRRQKIQPSMVRSGFRALNLMTTCKNSPRLQCSVGPTFICSLAMAYVMMLQTFLDALQCSATVVLSMLNAVLLFWGQMNDNKKLRQPLLPHSYNVINPSKTSVVVQPFIDEGWTFTEDPKAGTYYNHENEFERDCVANSRRHNEGIALSNTHFFSGDPTRCILQCF